MINLNLVIIGAYLNNNSDQDKYNGFLLGCYNNESNQFETVCRITLINITSNNLLFSKYMEETQVKPNDFHISELHDKPDVWISPKFVYQVCGVQISPSPTHTAAYNTIIENNGLSLLFGRFIKEIDYTSINDIATSNQIKSIYLQNQQNNK